jgi:[ribosomal protein S5]-alanine N-acetyltransferase
MEMMPYQPSDAIAMPPCAAWTPLAPEAPVTTTDWRTGVPVLGGPRLTLRELRVEDAPHLFAELTTEEVSRFISPPPTSVAGFEQFIRWAQRERAAGRYVCFAVVPEGQTTAVGLFQIRLRDSDRETAEWGFALGSAHWGTGLFLAGAQRVVDFAFAQMGVRRLEARAAVLNGRGNGALRKVGAVQEAVLRQSFNRHGERLDQALWTIAHENWWRAKAVWSVTVH